MWKIIHFYKNALFLRLAIKKCRIKWHFFTMCTNAQNQSFKWHKKIAKKFARSQDRDRQISRSPCDNSLNKDRRSTCDREKRSPVAIKRLAIGHALDIMQHCKKAAKIVKVTNMVHFLYKKSMIRQIYDC